MQNICNHQLLAEQTVLWKTGSSSLDMETWQKPPGDWLGIRADLTKASQVQGSVKRLAAKVVLGAPWTHSCDTGLTLK